MLISDNIYVKVIEVHGRSVKLGIDAPLEVEILREELMASAPEEHEPSCLPHAGCSNGQPA